MIDPSPTEQSPQPPEETAPLHAELPLAWTIGWSVICLVLFLLVGGTAQFLQLAWGLWFSELVLFAGTAVLGFLLIRIEPLRAMGLSRFDGRSLGLGFAFGALNYFAWAVPLMALAQAVFPKSMVERFDSSQIFARHSAVEVVIVLIGVSIAAPLGEELFFRGFLQRGLEGWRGAPRAIVATAFIFSAFHLDPVGLTARFELGVLFGLLAWRTGSLWAAMGAHAANNAISSLLYFLAGESTSEGDFVWWVPLVLFVVGNLGLLALTRSVWGTLPVASPMRLDPEPRSERAGTFALWLAAGAFASFALLLAVDFRGVQLNLVDGTVKAPRELRKRDDVKELRARARRGEVPVADYERLLRSLAPAEE
ncbi:MAG: CPBP family intramembrane glutamic endopeptidase [Myxococcota bacterium]